MRILLIEDNKDLAETILDRLGNEGHVVDHVADAELASEILCRLTIDLIIFDINQPGLRGVEILQALRSRKDHTSVLVLTAHSDIDDRVIGLDGGADDFMIKPIDIRELSARCRVLARRQAGLASDVFEAESLVFDRRARRAMLRGKDLDLRAREVQLLEVFIQSLGQVIGKEEVADRIYQVDESPTMNAVEQTVTRLRRKLDDSPLKIKTMRGLGYLAYLEDA